jgi:DNA polymerase I-like protein with 3'-5' exonuclease and polymerase domains
MELRIMAHLAEEESLIEAFNRPCSQSQGIDPFGMLAEEMDRNRADIKLLFYAVSYGMGKESLSKMLGCDVNSAAKWQKDLNARFPKV